MRNQHTDTPAWLSPEDEEKWMADEQQDSESRPPLIPKSFESLPATPRSAPAVTNALPEDL